MIDDEGCNCSCHKKNCLLCSQCAVNHQERREMFMDKYKPIETDREPVRRGNEV